MKNEIEQMEIAKVSSKGQIVIPQSIRQRLKVKEGSMFAVASCDSTLILKKIDNPLTKEDMNTMKLVEEAWEDIEKGRYKTGTIEEFEEQARKW
ncbi:MAG: AbrB/MazE/SpoVT family DNA-binding domain-containing protein [archaeon]